MNKAVFFDRDGIVNKRIIGGYVKKIEEFEFIEGFIDIFKMVKQKGYLAILVTNQQGIGKGLMTYEDLENVLNHMQTELKDLAGSIFDEMNYCSDLSQTNSFNRKPNPGMLLLSIEKNNVEPSVSWMIGDSISDAVAGRRAGVRTILIGDYSKELNSEIDYSFKNHRELLNFISENL